MRFIRTKPKNDGLSWIIVACIILVVWILTEVRNADAATLRACHRPSAAKIASLPREYPRFYRALRKHFRGAWKQAAIVSWGEGTWHWWASNGQYKGTFQMGSRERRLYGHSDTLAGQAYHASRYWRTHGWGPWECKP